MHIKEIIAFACCLTLSYNVFAASIEPINGKVKDAEIEKYNLENEHSITPYEYVKIRHSDAQLIDFVIKNYSNNELVAYAKKVNAMKIKMAKLNNTEVPKKIDNSVLSSREKIAEYLRQASGINYK